MWRWPGRSFFALVLVLLAGVGLTWWLGSRLPVEHAASSRTYIYQPPERVWQVLTDLEALPDWRTDLVSVQLIGETAGLPRWREESRYGSFELQVIEMQAPERLVVTLRDPGEQFGGRWTYTLAPMAGGRATRLTITEQGEIYHPLMRAMSHYRLGHHGTMDASLIQLAAHFGREVEPMHLPARPADR